METAFARKPFSTELVSAFSSGCIPGRQAHPSLSLLCLHYWPRWRTDGSGIRGNYRGGIRISFHQTPDEKMAKISPKGAGWGDVCVQCAESVKDFLTSNSFFLLVIFRFLLIRPGTQPGVFFLLNLDQFIVLAEKCYVTADTWKTVEVSCDIRLPLKDTGNLSCLCERWY